MNKFKAAVITASLFLFLLSGCSLKRTIVNSTGLIMDDVEGAFYEENDILFAQAAIPGNLKLLDGLIRGSNRENESLLIKGSKLYGMYAMAFLEDATADKKDDRENMARAKNFYKRARDYGMAALMKNNDFKKAQEGSYDEFKSSLQAFGKNDVEPLFWTAFSWGSFVNLSKNSPMDIADLPKVKAMIERVIEIDDTYFYGLPHLFMIVYYSMPKMFGGDTDLAKKEYDRVKEISGAKLALVEVYMAKHYAVQLQDRALFDTFIEAVNNTDDDVIPEIMFTKVAKKKAAVMAEKADQLF
jgi:hypothetical protein